MDDNLVIVLSKSLVFHDRSKPIDIIKVLFYKRIHYEKKSEIKISKWWVRDKDENHFFHINLHDEFFEKE